MISWKGVSVMKQEGIKLDTHAKRFAVQAMGYDEEQVDSYIRRLTAEYHGLRSRYTELYDKYDRLEKRPGRLFAAQPLPAPACEEARAARVLASAQREADRIVGSARIERMKLQRKKNRALREIGGIIDKLK